MSLSTHAKRVGELLGLPDAVRSSFENELGQVSTEIKCHASAAKGLLKISEDIMQRV